MATIQNLSAFYPQSLQTLRTILFWDTDIRKIDWQKQYKAVIRRVFERGDNAEREAITRFYGNEKVQEALKTQPVRTMTLRELYNKH